MPAFAHASIKAPTLLAHHLPEQELIKSLEDGSHEAILRTHFGDAYDDIASAAKRVKQKLGGASKRRVLMLPGIMASLLGEPEGKRNHVKWLDPTTVAKGHIFHLSFLEKPIVGTSVSPLLPCYLTLKLRLQLAGHKVDILHYDWRHDLQTLGKLIAAQIVADPSAKVALVCHSMGGMVARAALAGSAAANQKVDLIVQMGTPNLGAPGLAQAIRGTYPAVTQVAALDPTHTTEDYGNLLGTFPSAFALMPPRGAKFGIELRDPSVWPKTGVQPSKDLLAKYGATQDGLLKPDARFHLIVGGNLETVTAIRKQGDEFLYDYSYAGDGTVPWASSTVPGITKTWYADGVAHTSLCIDPSPCDAAADLLDGKKPSLPDSLKLKKEGVVKTETDASLLKGAKLLTVEGDARHLFDAAHAGLSKVDGKAQTIHDSMKKAGSWLKKHL